MPRQMPTTLINIFADKARTIEYLLDITFPTIPALRVSTGEEVKNLINYDNWIESVGEIRQTIEVPLDRVDILLQNKTQWAEMHTETNKVEWAEAQAVLFRRYRNAAKTLQTDVSMFSGGVENYNADDHPHQFYLQIIPDTLSLGRIVADRTLAAPCAFVFKDPMTCAYVGTGTVCDHHLKSGCTFYNNTHHFGGTEHGHIQKPIPPGSPGNSGGGGGGVDSNCPALDQFVLYVSGEGETFAKSVLLVKKGDLLLNPITGKCERVRLAEVVPGQELFEVVCANGAKSKASISHPLIRSVLDKKGTPLKQLYEAAKVLTWNGGRLELSEIFSIEHMATDSVMKIETEGDTHIYASGASGTQMILCHNSKESPRDPYDNNGGYGYGQGAY